MHSLMISRALRLSGNSNNFKRLVHVAAASGFSEESKSSQSYEKGRPTYSHASLQQINGILLNKTSQKPVNVVEIGAGTGKFTESFVDYFGKTHPNLSLQFTAIEPSEGFRKTLAEKNVKGVKAVDGTGDNIPAESKSADAVMIAQAFHWMDNVKTLKEIHRVLRPQGTLFLIWNTYDYSKDWLKIVDEEILTPTYGDVPRQQTEKWRQCFFDDASKPLFTPIHGWYDPYVFAGDRQMVLDRFLSTSVIVNLPHAQKDKVVVRINQLLDTHPDFEKARRTGVYEVPYVTHLAWVKAV
eukprot:gene1858-1986_t